MAYLQVPLKTLPPQEQFRSQITPFYQENQAQFLLISEQWVSVTCQSTEFSKQANHILP